MKTNNDNNEEIRRGTLDAIVDVMLARSPYGRQLRAKVDPMLAAGATEATIALFVAEKTIEYDLVTGRAADVEIAPGLSIPAAVANYSQEPTIEPGLAEAIKDFEAAFE